MKKHITRLFLVLGLSLLLSATALAAGETTVTPVNPAGKTVTATLETDTDGKSQYINLTVTGLTANEQYLVLMVSGIYTDASEAAITESTIRYIDQAAANGSVTFKVYPNSMQSSTILLSGKDVSLTIVATVKVPYIKGDANQDGKVNMHDATAVAKHSVKVAGATLTGNALSAAEVTNDNNVNMHDATKIAKFAVKAITSLD